MTNDKRQMTKNKWWTTKQKRINNKWQTTNDKRQRQMTNDERQMTSNKWQTTNDEDKWQNNKNKQQMTKTNDEQQTTNYKRQTTNNKRLINANIEIIVQISRGRECGAVAGQRSRRGNLSHRQPAQPQRSAGKGYCTELGTFGIFYFFNTNKWFFFAFLSS